MSNLVGMHEALGRLEAAWAGAGDAQDLSREQLVAVNDAIGVLQRRLSAVQVEVAAGIARESRPELGAGSLAKEQGFRSPAKLIAATVGVSARDAAGWVAVGEATAPRADLLGARLPAKYPRVREALASGVLGVQAAALIIGVLERCRVAAGAVRIAEAERVLVDAAAGLAVDAVRRLVVRAEAWLDPDGVPPREEEARSRRSLTMFERDGMLHLNAVLDVESAAPVVAAVRGVRVGGVRCPHGRPVPGCSGCGSAHGGDDPG